MRFLLKCRLTVCKFNFCEDLVHQIIQSANRLPVTTEKSWAHREPGRRLQIIWIASDTQVWFEVWNIFFKCSLINPFFPAWSVAGIEMRVLILFSRFFVRADVRAGVKSLAFRDNSVKEICFFLWYFSRKFYGWMVPGEINWCISNFSVSHRENPSSMYVFHSRGQLILLLLIISVCTADIKMLAKATATLVPIAVPRVGRWSTFSFNTWLADARVFPRPSQPLNEVASHGGRYVVYRDICCTAYIVPFLTWGYLPTWRALIT